MIDGSTPFDSTDATLSDPTYRAALVDLFGVLAYGELVAFERLAADAAMASILFTSAIAAPEDAAIEHHSSQNSGQAAHSMSVRFDESRPRRGGCSRPAEW